MRIRQAWFLAPFVLLAALTVACGGDDDATTGTTTSTTATGASKTAPTTSGPSATASSAATATSKPAVGGVSPCDLITKAEAESAIGETLADGKIEPMGGITQCLYTVEGGNIATDPWVSIQYSPRMTREEFEDNVHIEGLPDPNPISGLGDVAYENTGTFVLKGEMFVGITVATRGASDEVAIQNQLAQVAVGRLP